MATSILSLTREPVSAALVAYPDPARPLHARLALRQPPLAPEALATFAGALQPLPHQRRYLTHEKLAATLGTYPGDIALLTAYFQPLGVEVADSDSLTGHLLLTGKASDFEQAFQARIGVYEAAGRVQFLAFTTPYRLPDSLQALLRAEQPLQLPVRKEWRRPTRPLPPSPAGAVASPGYSPVELGQAYQFPAQATGAGQVIGIVELGGKLSKSDLTKFFAGLGRKPPRIVEVGTPPNAQPDGNAEVALDLQVAGALAPQAKLVVYYGATLLQALQAVVGDAVNKPTVLSVSWSGAENHYSPAEVQQMDLLLYQASLLGITVVASSGDAGAYNTQPQPNVPLPTSNPWVLGCGGTIAVLAGSELASEVVWNEQGGQAATGGGYSSLYPQPAYQAQAVAAYPYPALRAPTRGVPDVAAEASDQYGYRLIFGGQPRVVGGTSGATPLVAALIALLNEELGYSLGYLNPVLYALAGSDAFRPITQGNNQLFPAAPYWSPCTGLGSPVGTRLLAQLRALAEAAPPAPPAASSSAAPADAAPADEVPAGEAPAPS